MSLISKKLFLVDGMSLVFRAHFAFNKTPRITSYGLNTGAILGYTNSLLELINNQKPSHLALAFDTKEPTFRHIEYPLYKAQRQAAPEDLLTALPYIFEITTAMNIPLLIKPGFEADDIIGTVVKKSEIEGFTNYMMTMDKDYCQLVTDKTLLYKPAYAGNSIETWGTEQVLEKWKIKRVEQVCDILGICGDKSDNIPGIPGIGEKTAYLLIEQYDSIENLIVHAKELKGRQKDLVIQYAQQALLSKKLATIKTDVPIEFDLRDFELKNSNTEVLKKLFTKLEFRSLLKKMFETDTSLNIFSDTEKKNITSQTSADLFSDLVEPETENKPEEIFLATEGNNKNISTVSHQYRIVDDVTSRNELITYLMLQTEFCFDTETTHIEPVLAEITGLSLSCKKGEAFYIPLPGERKNSEKILAEFQELFLNEKILKIGQNIKYDLIVLNAYGIKINGPFFDTMLAHYLLEPEQRHNMDFLSETYLHYSPISIETLIGKKGKNQKKMSEAPLDKVAEYSCEDADVTFQLKELFAPLLKSNNLEKLFFEVEIPLVPVLADMEKEGVSIDISALGEYSKELEHDSRAIELKIYELAGEKFNIASPRQLGIVLFDKLKIEEKVKKTKTGQYATGEDILSILSGKHLIVSQILDFRELQKLQSTYVDTLPKLVSPADGKIHTSYNQAVTSTGRLSSNNPNLQNIPIRTEKGREIRKAFIPKKKENVIISADYSQIELRIMAEVSGDSAMISAFCEGKDFHTATAARMYKVELDQVSSEMRRNAKMVNFGIIYGISAYGLSQRLNIPKKDAAVIIESYFNQYPKVKEYMDKVIKQAKDTGFVKTLLGRRRFLRDINSKNFSERGFAERNAINMPIQGTAADMIKIAMIKIHEVLKNPALAGIDFPLETKLIMQVHDELVFDAPEKEIEIVIPLIKDKMKNAIPLKVPVEVEINYGKDWLQAH